MEFENWYYIFDPDTKNYVNAIYASEKPDNSTEIDPQNLIAPLYDPETKSWVETYQNDSTENKTSEELISDLTQQLAVAQINQAKTNASLIQQNAELTKQVLALQSGKETTNG
ncbi:hypothetical protein [Leuconostoc mesenteroides]|uniref:hypothetical protein n=1 Tax=Leuconostoc mesenteroides TaxID=1245 RepID=UPI0021C21B34|nr:hypothetical protein [Leuconostoc mesenteroides]MCT8386063.1 hypothetical protein [Leuconostoc mesenteroides]